MSGTNRQLIQRVYNERLGFVAKVRVKGKSEWLFGRVFSNVFMQRGAAKTYPLNELRSMERTDSN